jgi:uroporphyrinogen decarboxylase
MNGLINDTLLRALLSQPVDYTPIWVMRQAGRYLPEYRAVRKQAGSFMQLMKNPELAALVTLQPLKRFPLDAAILFSDILTIPDAMGLGLHFIEGEGPRFEKPILSLKDIEALPLIDPHTDLSYVLSAIKLIKHDLAGAVPLIGFCGSPWTLATYMIAGKSDKSFAKIKRMLVEEPMHLHLLLDKLADAVIAHLNAQIEAGVQAVMIFDTWGGILSTEEYSAFSLFYAQKILRGLIREHDGRIVPRILFTKNGGAWLEQMADSGCDALGIDWLTDIGQARARVGHRVALQGNLQPEVMAGTPADIQANVARILGEFGSHSGHVFNLGHGITPDIDPDNVAILVESVHSLSKQYHRNASVNSDYK